LCADFNGDGVVDPDDLADFISAFFFTPPVPGPGGYATANECAWPYIAGLKCDFNRDCNVDPDDLADFISAFFVGC